MFAKGIGRTGYRLDDGVAVQLDMLNLVNAAASEIDDFCTSRLPRRAGRRRR